MCELIKKLEKFVDKETKEDKEVTCLYLHIGEEYVKIKPVYKEDYRVLRILAKEVK